MAQQDAERRPEQPGGGEQQVAADAWLPMVVIDSKPNTSRPAMMVAPPRMRWPVGRSPSTSVARISPDKAAQAGWIVVPWPSGTSKKPV